jgi:hypothetical protein
MHEGESIEMEITDTLLQHLVGPQNARENTKWEKNLKKVKTRDVVPVQDIEGL